MTKIQQITRDIAIMSTAADWQPSAELIAELERAIDARHARRAKPSVLQSTPEAIFKVGPL